MIQVAALFVDCNSIYKKMPAVDCWDINRDASRFPGGMPVVCHPPCRTWGHLKGLSKGSNAEHALAIQAVGFVRENGGVLEHPSGSGLWKLLNLPQGNTLDAWGGFTLSVSQRWWGHKAEKRTYLYVVGVRPGSIPDFPISFDLPTHLVTGNRRNKRGKRLPELSKKARAATPERFACWLVELARSTQSI